MVEKVHVDKNRMNSIRNTMQESSSPNASLLGRHDEGIRGGVFNEILANLKNLNVSHLIESQIQSIRPWLDDFFCSDAFETPKDGYPEIKRRLQINIQYYLSNYLAIGSILFLYIVVTHIVLALIMIGVGSGALYATGLPEDYSIVVAGMLFRKRTILLTTGVIFIAILIITDVGSSILWLIGVSVFGVLGHAALRKPAAAAIPATEFDEPL